MALAAALYSGQIRVLELLLRAGADPELPDFSGVSAREVAERLAQPELAARLQAAQVRAESEHE